MENQTKELGTRYSSEETRVRAEGIIQRLLASAAEKGITGEYHGNWYYYQLEVLDPIPYRSLVIREDSSQLLTVDLNCVRVQPDGEVLYEATLIDEDHPEFEATLLEEFFKQRSMIPVANQKEEELRLAKESTHNALVALRVRHPKYRIDLESEKDPVFCVVLRGLTEAQVDQVIALTGSDDGRGFS